MRRNRYIEYDQHESFTEDIETADECMIQKMLETGKIKCAYASKKITSGRQVEIEIYPEFTRKQIRQDSTIKRKTNDVQKNLNSRNARKKLERLINVNFSDGDIWLTLTYARGNEPPDIATAQKNIVNYLRRLKRKAKKRDIELKYIYVTEYSERKGIRCHHHLIISGEMTLDEVEETWNLGKRNNARRIKEDEKGLAGLSEYISKDPKGSKRWGSSMNLKQPIVRKNHQDFRRKQIRKMTENKNVIREMIEKKYPDMTYLNEEAKYNQHNGFTYFYIRLVMPERSVGKRE